MFWGRAYFAVQALAGAIWWIAVALSPLVRGLTLGQLNAPLVAAFDIPLFVLASVAAACRIRIAAWVATTWTCLVLVSLAAYATITTEAGCGVLLMAVAAGSSVIALCLVQLGHVPTAWIAFGPFAFRAAGPRRTSRRRLVDTAAQIVLFWGLFLGVLPAVLRFLEYRWGIGIELPTAAKYLGIALLIVASALGIWSAIAMSVDGDGTPLPSAMANRLVVSGPYRFVRNPMAVAGITQGVAVGLMLSSWVVIVYSLIGSLLWNFAIRPLEEADLGARFGTSYSRYHGAVRCWIPRLSPRSDPVR